MNLRVPHPSRPLRRVGSYDRLATNLRSSVSKIHNSSDPESHLLSWNKAPSAGVYQDAMYSTAESSSLRDFWIELLPLCKLYALYLGGVAFYTVFSLTGIMVRLRSLKSQTATEQYENRYRRLALLHNKTDNLRQLSFFSTLLFGFVFFLQIPANFRSLDDSSLTGWDFILHSLAIYFDFAAGAFLVLIILHVVQWIVSAELRSLTLPH